MFDGIERPLNRIEAEHGAFIPEGIGLSNLDLEKKMALEAYNKSWRCCNWWRKYLEKLKKHK